MEQEFEQREPKVQFAYAEEFADAYNTELGTQFAVFDGCLKDEEDYDFRLMDKSSQEILKIQHKFHGANPREYIGRKSVEELFEHLRDLTKAEGGLSIYLSFADQPPNKKTARIIAEFIVDEVLPKAKEQPPVTFSFDVRDGYIHQLLSQWGVSKLEVTQVPELENVSFGISQGANICLGDDQRIATIVESAESKYSNPEDLILLIECVHIEISAVFLPMIRRAHANSSLRGIWLDSNWTSTRSRFIRIK